MITEVLFSLLIRAYTALHGWNLLVILAPLLWYIWWKKPHSRFPPGPRGVPILGILPFVGENLERVVKKWSLEKYGPVMSARMGSKDVVMLNTYESINEAFRKHGDIFSGRPWITMFSQVLGRSGIVVKDYGEDYKTLKHFTLQSLKNFGMGKKEMETTINEEIKCILRSLKSVETEPINLQHQFVTMTANIISKLAFGKKFNYSDPVFQLICNAIEKQSSPDHPKFLLVCFLFSSFRYIPPFREANEVYVKSEEDVFDAIRPIIDEHKRNFDSSDIRDVIDAFLYERNCGVSKDDFTFSDRELLVLMRDMLIGGTETTSITLNWVFLAYLLHPEYHKSLIDEIDVVIGNKEPSMEHKKSMPITSAFVQEVMRFCTLVPNGLPHYALQDIEFRGYHIPKGTEVYSNIWGAHNDPNTWKDPNVFNPDRHLDKDGNFVHSSKIIPFSVGPRFCVGESLARMEIFLVFCNILQTFSIETYTVPLPSLENGKNSGLYMPKPFKVLLKARR